MATEKQANRAREIHSDLLVERGAHGIGVADGRAYGKQGFVVVAYVEPQRSHNVPSRLNAELGGRRFEVDVVTVPSERFRPE